MAVLIQIDLPHTPDAAGRSRRFLHGCLWELSPALVADVVMAASELVSNAVKHSDVGPDGSIVLEAELRNGSVRVDVSDAGTGFDPQAVTPQPGFHGLGLVLVARVAEEWGTYRDVRHHVWFRVQISAGD